MTGSDRSAVRARVAEAVEQGARQHTAGEMVRGGPRTAPRNTRSPRERAQRVALAARPTFCTASPPQIVPRLADRGESLASASSFSRGLTTHDLLAHRGRATPAHRARPRA